MLILEIVLALVIVFYILPLLTIWVLSHFMEAVCICGIVLMSGVFAGICYWGYLIR